MRVKSLAYIIQGYMEKQRIKTDFTDFHELFIISPSNLEDISNLDYSYRFAVSSKTKENKKKQEKTI